MALDVSHHQVAYLELRRRMRRIDRICDCLTHIFILPFVIFQTGLPRAALSAPATSRPSCAAGPSDAGPRSDRPVRLPVPIPPWSTRVLPPGGLPWRGL